jgi:hypothetical protein
LLWLDAADTSTITTSGNQVTQWRNKGTFQGSASNAPNKVVTSGTATYNGLNIIQFPQGTNLAITMLIPNQPRAWFAVFRQTYQLNAQNPYFQIFGAFAYGYDQISGPEFNGSMNEYRNSITGMVDTTSATSGFNVFRIYNWTNSAASTSLNRIAINGTALPLTGSLSATGYATGSVEYLIMNGYLPSADLAELICINAEITVLQRQQIEYYLSQKWGIAGPPAVSYGPSASAYGPSVVSLAASVTPALPIAHPFVKITPSTILPFFPTNISGCCLWLDGYDPLGTGTQPSNSTALTSWVDKSGSNNTMTAINGPTWSYLLPKVGSFRGGAVLFNGTTQYLFKNTPVVSNAYTLFILYRQTSGSGPLYTTTTTTLSNGLFANNAGTTYLTRGDSTWYTAASVFPSNAYNLAVTSYTSVGSNASLYYNGSNVVSTSLTNSIAYSNLTIGSRQNAAGNDYFAGVIAEVVGYAGTLTDDQRQRVEGYLARKYNF